MHAQAFPWDKGLCLSLNNPENTIFLSPHQKVIKPEFTNDDLSQFSIEVGQFVLSWSPLILYPLVPTFLHKQGSVPLQGHANSLPCSSALKTKCPNASTLAFSLLRLLETGVHKVPHA